MWLDPAQDQPVPVPPVLGAGRRRRGRALPAAVHALPVDEVGRGDGRAPRGARAPRGPAPPGPRAHRAGPRRRGRRCRRGGRRRAVRRRSRPSASLEVLETRAGRGARPRRGPSRRSPTWSPARWSHRPGLLEQRRPADARPSAAITRQRAPARARDDQLGAASCSTAGTCCSARAHHATTWWIFSWAELTVPGVTGSVSLRPGEPTATRAWRTPRESTSASGVCSASVSSLTTEERTKNASAGDRPSEAGARSSRQLRASSVTNPRTCRPRRCSQPTDGRSNRSSGQPVRREVGDLDGEFDPGSGRTLAACLTHASRTRSIQWQHW